MATQFDSDSAAVKPPKCDEMPMASNVDNFIKDSDDTMSMKTSNALTALLQLLDFDSDPWFEKDSDPVEICWFPESYRKDSAVVKPPKCDEMPMASNVDNFIPDSGDMMSMKTSTLHFQHFHFDSEPVVILPDLQMYWKDAEASKLPKSDGICMPARNGMSCMQNAYVSNREDTMSIGTLTPQASIRSGCAVDNLHNYNEKSLVLQPCVTTSCRLLRRADTIDA
ncbi:uncharacterized protein [Ptychodera flava]|uniref:uncharacterized protein isoform X2 n=1 Tax=Ptychodera flava TaxID=63121 RepID=UPI00396A3F8C